MAFCPNCGSSVEGRFCAKCGASVAAPGAPPPAAAASAAYGASPAPPPPSYSAPPPPPGYNQAPGYNQPPGYNQASYVPPPAPVSAPGLTENVACALCYALGWITGIVFLVLAPYNQNRTVRFHAWQSIFFFGAATVLSIIFGTVMFNSFYGYGFWPIYSMFYLLFRLALLACWLFLMFKAYNNQRFVIPVIGPLAEKQANS